MAYVPLFTETQTTFPPSLRLGTEFETLNSKVPSRINREYTNATQQAYDIGNIAAATGITHPQSLVNLSHDPMAASMVRSMDLVPKDNSRSVRPDPYKKFEEQGLSSDYRHALGTSAFKDSIIDWAASNLGMNKNSGILNAIGSGVAKGATIFEEGKDALSRLKEYSKMHPYDGIQDYDSSYEKEGLTLSEILAQPKEDFTANWFAADQIPFGTSPVKKMEMIDAYRKYGPQLYMRQLQNKKKQNFQDIVRREEAAAAAEKARLERLERLGRDKDRGGFDPSGPTQKSIRRRREDKSGRGHIGGFTDPGKGSYGPHKADGGLINFYRYGGFI